MKISDILEKAADNFEKGANCYGYSCSEIGEIAFVHGVEQARRGVLFDGLQEMGLDRWSFNAFSEFKTRKDRRKARSIWLTWAAMMAREQGL